MVLSIIIPIYNTEGYLRRCFDSIVCNKTEEYEAILVNDGSTDNSRKICEDFVRQYPPAVPAFQQTERRPVLRTELWHKAEA